MDQEMCDREQHGKAAGIQRNADGDETGRFLKFRIDLTVQRGCPQSARLSYGCCSGHSQEQRDRLQGVMVVQRLLLWPALLRTCQTLKHKAKNSDELSAVLVLFQNPLVYKVNTGFKLPTVPSLVTPSSASSPFCSAEHKKQSNYLYWWIIGLFESLAFCPMSIKVKGYSIVFQLITTFARYRR